MIGLTSLWTSEMPDGARNSIGIEPYSCSIRSMRSCIGRKTKDRERDVRFVELGEFLCEVRAKQFWRVENLRSFDEFLEKRFPESRRKAYYLMAIHENLTKVPKLRLRQLGWSKAVEMVKVARRDEDQFDCATWLHKAEKLPKEEFKRAVEKHLTGKDSEPWELIYFKVFKSHGDSDEGDRGSGLMVISVPGSM